MNLFNVKPATVGTARGLRDGVQFRGWDGLEDTTHALTHQVRRLRLRFGVSEPHARILAELVFAQGDGQR